MKSTKLPKPGTLFVISISDWKHVIKLSKCMAFFFSLINRAENPNKIYEYSFPIKWLHSTENTQNECAIYLTQFLLLPFTYSRCVQKSPNSKHQNLVENSKIIWAIYCKSLRISPPCVRCIEIAITIQFAPKQVSSLQKFITFAVDFKWRPKFPTWKD